MGSLEIAGPEFLAEFSIRELTLSTQNINRYRYNYSLVKFLMWRIPGISMARMV
jgi:hypothetical protein